MNIKNSVKILRLDDQGRGIGYIDNKIIFIPNALPEEEVIVEQTETEEEIFKTNGITEDQNGSTEDHRIINTEKEISEYSESYKHLKSIDRDIKKISADDSDKAARIDMLKFQIGEIEAAAVEEVAFAQI